MVGDVGVLDVMEGVVEEPAVVPVNGREGPSYKVPCLRGIVREVDVRVLEKRDGHQPAVDEEIWDPIVLCDRPEGRGVDGVGEG